MMAKPEPTGKICPDCDEEIIEYHVFDEELGIDEIQVQCGC